MNRLASQVAVARPTLDLVPSFYASLDSVAKEKRFIEMIEAPPYEKVLGFQTELIESGGPIAYAIDGADVVGWADIFPSKNPRLSHRGGLGMGIRQGYRGIGLGTRLLACVLEQAKAFGLEKVELQVYTSNVPAIRLYEKSGFEPEGLIKKYRKLDGEYFDCLSMAKFL